MLTHAAYYVVDNYKGKLLNYVQLRKHPKYKETWKKYFSNERGRLCQEFRKEKKGLGKRVEGTNTFM